MLGTAWSLAQRQVLLQVLRTLAVALFSYAVTMFVSRQMFTRFEDAAIQAQKDFDDTYPQEAQFDEL